MPVYNASGFLVEAVNSIIDQTFTDWELIVVNDGSTDNSEAIIKKYNDSRIKYYRNEKNEGLIYTLNKAIGLSNGKYIVRMDADDIALPERLQLQYDFLSRNKEYAMCGGNAIVINGEGDNIGKIVNLQSDEYLRIHLLFSVPFIHPSVMIRAGILKNNLFDPAYKHAEDYELWCRIADDYKIANLNMNLLRYRWHNTNVSVLNQKKQDEVKDQIIIEQLKKIGLIPTREELDLHKITFNQYSAKDTVKKKEPFTNYQGLDKWFSKIMLANKSSAKYNPDALIAYLWSRWIVLCIAQKKVGKIFKPTFATFNFNILRRTFKLILFYRKK